MVKVLVLIHKGFEEIELIAVVDILRRAKAEVIVASVHPGQLEVVGQNKIKLIADQDYESVKDKDFDLLVVPGGIENAKGLGSHPGVIEKYRKQKESGKWYAAICASPLYLLEANGLLDGVQGTSYPGMHLNDRTQEAHNVVVSKNCITSRSPGTAMEFALKLVEVVICKEKAADLAKMIMFQVKCGQF